MNGATHWTVPPDHPVFAGHFPGTPILPGVMLLDAVLNAIAAATGTALDICEISAVKFLGPAGPGEELVIRHVLAAGGAIHFDVVAGARKIASGSIMPGSPV
jgi:3-hydroxymyristoyl/3-hydroxydecanoyl-(acyl carrier protein) dehydratase